MYVCRFESVDCAKVKNVNPLGLARAFVRSRSIVLVKLVLNQDFSSVKIRLPMKLP